MHKIERLLQTLAPKGVEFRKLGEVCDFQKGKSITKKAVTFGKVPVISGGRQPAYYHNEANRSGETIAISSSGVMLAMLVIGIFLFFLLTLFLFHQNKKP
ncbi:restriction endonuclease subunit S [Helicobacter pylori]|nr:restriction endonuclease subunit S [Helicobacter pylori]